MPLPPPPAPVAAFRIDSPPVDEEPSGPVLAGYHGGFFLRDAKDRFRLYPRLRLHIDGNSYFGKGVSSLPASAGGNAVKPRLFVRRARLEVAGTFFERWSFVVGGDLSQVSSNNDGKTEQSAAAAGKDPTADTARFAPVQAAGASAAPADAWINYSLCPCLNVMAGQYQAPFSMENRTSNNVHPWIERNLPIRGFVVPTSKEIGVTVWGDLPRDVVGYQVGVFAGDGQNRPQVDNRADVIGRVFVRPLVGREGPLAAAQIGVSGRHGVRDPDYVGYDYPAITTGQGFALWSPTYTDSLGRTTHVLPSGSQDAIGGELRVPLSRAALQAEAYYVANDTREAVDGFQLANTERLGQIEGVAWYAQLSFWPSGEAFVTGEPGFSTRPVNVDLSRPAKEEKSGVELLAIVGGVQATYAGASRGGAPDDKTPGSAKNPATDIAIREYGLGLSYWRTRHLRWSINYIAYQTPGSGSADNLARVPGNLGDKPDARAHVLHELGTRLGVMF